MKLEHKEVEDNIVITTTMKMYTKIYNKQEEETMKAIKKYCDKKGYFANLIPEEQLDLILKLGIEKYNQLENQYDIRSYIE